MRLMVTGSRDWTDAEKVRRALIGHVNGPVTLIHGGAEGLDLIAGCLADEFGWQVRAYLAKWVFHGKSAGPIRNAEMIATKPDLVIAFPLPGSKGTWDAVAKAEAAGIKVIIPYPELAGERNR